jgi:hypothetical protein
MLPAFQISQLKLQILNEEKLNCTTDSVFPYITHSGASLHSPQLHIQADHKNSTSKILEQEDVTLYSNNTCPSCNMT